MDLHWLALLIVVPFGLIFLYAGLLEYRRYKSEGTATYGLVYDEETGTTHVGGIAEDEEGFDPDDFDPSEHNTQGDDPIQDDDKA